jgi:hypothetical protein
MARRAVPVAPNPMLDGEAEGHDEGRPARKAFALQAEV